MDVSRAPHRTALGQALVLAGLCLLVFREEVAGMVRSALRNPESAHLLAAPLLAGLLVWARRRRLADDLRQGSAFGLLLLVASVALLGLMHWPFNFGAPRRLLLVPALAGAVLAVGGWRVLGRCGPILLLILVAIPSGSRYYYVLLAKPAAFTLEVSRALLDTLPGIAAELEGTDMRFEHSGRAGIVAPGEPHRGASLLPALATLGLFVTCLRVRPLWQILLIGVIAGPLLVVASVAHFLIWSLVTIYGDAGPLSGAPKAVATAGALTATWAAFATLSWLVGHLLTGRDTGMENSP